MNTYTFYLIFSAIIYFTYFIANSFSIVPKSSTYQIAYLFFVPIACIMSLLPIIVYKKIFSILKEKSISTSLDTIKNRSFYITLFLLLIVVASYILWSIFNPKHIQAEEDNTFGIKISSIDIKKINLQEITPQTSISNHEVNYDCNNGFLKGSIGAVNIKNNRYDFNEHLTYLPYVNSASTETLAKNGTTYYIFLLNLRATSNRALLLVYTSPQVLIYKELIDTSFLDTELVLGSGLHKSYGEVITLSKHIRKHEIGKYSICDYSNTLSNSQFQYMETVYQIQ